MCEVSQWHWRNVVTKWMMSSPLIRYLGMLRVEQACGIGASDSHYAPDCRAAQAESPQDRPQQLAAPGTGRQRRRRRDPGRDCGQPAELARPTRRSEALCAVRSSARTVRPATVQLATVRLAAERSAGAQPDLAELEQAELEGAQRHHASGR